MFKRLRLNQHANRLLLNALNAPENLPDLPPADWDLLLRVARRVRLLGRLQADLARLGLIDAIPARAANHLRAARTVIDHRKTLVTWEVNRLLWALREIDTPLILLKGAAYVLAGLPPAPGRLFADVDLLVAETHISQIEDSLATRGWMKLPLDPYDDRYYRVWMHEIPPLRHQERGTEIDIHHRLLPRTSRFSSDPAPLLQAARPVADDPRLRVLAPADMVLHGMVHLFLEGDPKEGLRFRDLLDAHDLLCHFSHSAGFWAELLPRARQLGFQRPLYYSLRFSHALFATPIPVEVLAASQQDGPAWLWRWLMDRLVPLAMLPGHPDHPRWLSSLAKQLLYIRAHWLRMPAGLLIRHLAYKAWLRLRGIRKQVELPQLDLGQQ